jgi:hypothetical protein
MMWLQVHTSLVHHPKTARLARRLRVPKAQAIGHLVALWLWCLEYAPDGELSKFDVEEIAEAALWEQDAAQFVEALVAAGFLDRNDDVLSVHDWDQYGGKILESRELHRERQARYRQRQRPHNECDEGDGHVTVTCSSRDRHVTSTCSARDALDKIREDKIREEKNRPERAADAAPGAADAAPSSSSSSSSLVEEVTKGFETVLEEYKKLKFDEQYKLLARDVELCQRAAARWHKLTYEQQEELFDEDINAWAFLCEAAELEQACAVYLRATNKKRCTIAEREYLNAMLNSIADADIVLDAITEAAASTDNVNLKYIAAIARERAGGDWEPVGPLRRNE